MSSNTAEGLNRLTASFARIKMPNNCLWPVRCASRFQDTKKVSGTADTI